MERRAARRLRVWHLARLVRSCNQGAPVRQGRKEPIAGLSKGGALKTLRTQRAVRYWSKTNPLRNLCGGRLHRWLTLWVLGRGRDSTPWPGWPACRLILARFVPENCSSLSTDRVTMDTTMWPVPWKAEQLRQWWRRRSFRDTRSQSETDRKSTRLNSSHGYISYAVFCLKKKKKRSSNELLLRDTYGVSY